MRRLLCLLPLLVACAVPSAAAAQSTVRVQGTTDTTDSGLVAEVIKPGFEATYPQYKLQYIAVGTGQALTNARAGQGDAVLTHAPTSEKKFVDDGYSSEPTGRAIMFNDYVIIAQNRDPAGVTAGARHDAVHALELVAQAGQAGNAIWVSRGDDSGTHVQEGLMWAQTTGVPTHSLGAGRAEPDGDGNPATTDDTPAWYKKAALGQAKTVQVANQCNFGDPRDRCYVMTDRGTFDRQTQIAAIGGMKIVSDRNSDGARGGPNLLINPFHVYAVSPAKQPAVNLSGALAFLDYLTSPAFQNALASYPSAANPRFFADAYPDLAINSPALPARINAGDAISVTGTLVNRLPGAGAVSAPLSLEQSLGIPGSPFAPEPGTFGSIAGGASDGNGNLGFTVAPTRSGAVRVAFPRSGDLSPTTYPVGNVSVGAVVNLQKATASYRRLRVQGALLPASGRRAATLRVEGRRPDVGGPVQFSSQALPSASGGYDVAFKIPTGRWLVKVAYQDPGTVEPAETREVAVNIPGRVSLKLDKLNTLKKHRVRVRGSFSPKAAGRKARVELFAHRRGAKGGFKRIATKHPKKGGSRYAFTVTLRPGKWQLRVRYRHAGVVDTTTSRKRSVSVR
jgi:tungstate transport system substrate-binding protein